MSLKITLKNVASYKETTELSTDKKINLVYGLNGTGKTVLSNYLYEKKQNEKSKNFLNCSDDFDESTLVLVYNEKFITDNFYEKDKIPGVFTLSSENKKALENIKEAEEELQTLNSEREQTKKKITNLRNEFEKENNKYHDNVWKIKEQYTGGDRLLDYCFKSLKGNKETLFKHLLSISRPDSEPEKKIKDLKNTLQSIKEGKTIQPIQKLEIKPSDIEKKSIFQETIIGSQDSSVSQKITELKNQDWMQKGLQYLPKDIQEAVECPFCQKKTITEQFINEINNYFDQSYKEKTDKISDLKNQYNNIISTVSRFQQKNSQNSFIKDDQDRYNSLISRLKLVLNNNLKKIQEKIEKPSHKISLESSQELLVNLDQFVNEINQKISNHNQRIKNSQIEEQKIKTIFWNIMRLKYDSIIETYKKEKKIFVRDAKGLNKIIDENKKKINEQKKIIEQNQKNTVNVEEAVSNINKNLKNIGINDFKITKQTDDESYFLKRSSSNGEFKSFSEGEKTVISFLYFLELCQGKASRGETSGQKIIVIDDPISSLSHIYIFNVAQFIKNQFFNDTHKKYQTVFVLTHNLYFFHELAGYKKEEKEKEVNLFRITKKPFSQISSMKKEEVKNDYESYWAILKDWEQNKKDTPILPNVMRNILEHFFGFIDKNSLANALSKIDNNKYSAFIRYMNRESHSDRENLSDTKEIDPSFFFDAFKEIFEKSGYKKHYNKMMK